MRIYVQERANETQRWMLGHLSADKCAAFETFITPKRDKGQKAADLKAAKTLIERAGGNVTDIDTQIVETEQAVEEVEAAK